MVKKIIRQLHRYLYSLTSLPVSATRNRKVTNPTATTSFKREVTLYCHL